MQDYKAVVRDRILAGESFVRAVFSGNQPGQVWKWIKVTIRPVRIKGALFLQFSYFDEHKDVTKNYSGEEAIDRVAEIVDSFFKNIHVETIDSVIEIRITKKGKALISEKQSIKTPEPVDFSHDRNKPKLLSSPEAIPFLQIVGIMTKDGKIKADMQRKFRQINEFLRIVDETNAFSDLAQGPVQVVDFGCGNAYLTFAIYFYLNEILGVTACVAGVDIKAELLERHQEKAKLLNWDRLKFQIGRIADYQPDIVPDLVIALHACDTATDDALAQGIRWGSKFIVAAPCCQHELQCQLSQVPIPDPFKSVAHDGILNERLGDILTDTFRAAILRILGYHTEVIQFVSTEHTAKNLMIRAVKNFSPGNIKSKEEYLALKNYWHVRPYLETLLGIDYSHWLQG